MKTACFTGHRKLKGKYDGEDWDRLTEFMEREVFPVLIERYKITNFISGMATGFDMLAAEMVIRQRHKYNFHISLEAAIPYKNQYQIWPKTQQMRYHTILKVCDNVNILYGDKHVSWKLQKRNEYMVDNSDFLIAMWDGTEHGGTYNCFKYAEKIRRPTFRIEPFSLWWTNLSWVLSM